MLLYY